MAVRLLYQYIFFKKERLRLKLRTTKKIVSCILSVLLLASALILPASANEISDSVTDENTKSYLVDSEKTFDGTSANKLDITSDLDFLKDNGSATWTMTFKTTDNANLQVLTGLFSGTNTNDYLIFYAYNGKLGAEIRNATNNVKVAFDVAASYADGNYHTVTFTVSENAYYKIYFDGSCILTKSAESTTFSKNLGVDFATASVGGASRYNNTGWQFNGSIKDVYLSNFALDETEILKFHGIYPVNIINQVNQKDTTGTEVINITDEFDFDTIKTMRQGSMNITYKKDADVGNSLYTLIACSDADQTDNYANFYVSKAGTRVGFELKYGTKSYQMAWDGVSLNDNNWHNIGFVYSGNGITLYVDGKAYGEKTIDITLQDFALWAAGIDTVTVGGMTRGSYNTADKLWYSDFNISNITLYSNVLSESQMASIQSGTGNTAVSETQVSDRTALFYSGYGNSANYRIPALVTAKDGTLVAAADQRKTTASDYGDIDLMVRRSEDKGETWSDPIMLTDLPSGGSNHSFIIDSELLVSQDGTIYCLVDMFPESLALMGSLETGSGYTEVDGKKYLTLYDSDKNVYTMREDNIVYDANGDVTAYKVKNFATGELVKTVDGVEQAAGSIFLYTGANAGELSVLKTSYLWLFKSTDNGETWSDPIDVTGMVKADWMVFCGTGPGRGTTTIMPDGKERLIFSIYHTNSVGNLNSQASAVIYSDDGGETWTRGESPVVTLGYDPSTDASVTQLTENAVIDLGGGKLAMFSRNYSGHAYMSISTDGGATWESSAPNNAVYDCYCQMSALKHEYNGRTYLIIANPNASGRNNMTIRVTDITDGTISTNTDDWKYTTINVGHDQYSCLTSIDENTIGILYESDTTWHALDLLFQKFDFAYLLQGNGGNINNVPEYPEITGITGEVVNGENGKENVTEVGDTVLVKVTLGTPVFVTGNAQVKLQYTTANQGKTVYADYVSGSGTNEITFAYKITEEFKGDLYAVIEPIANLESSTGRSVSSLRNGETVAVASYGIAASDGSFDLNVVGATAGSYQSGQGPELAIDNKQDTIWHSQWSAGNNRKDLWITLDLGEVKTVTGLRYLPRTSQTNGIITEYQIEVSTDGVSFTPCATGNWAGDNTWKKAEFGPVEARYVKLVAVNSMSTESANTYASASEIAVYYIEQAETGSQARDTLTTAIESAKTKLEEIKADTTTFWHTPDVEALEAKIAEAEALLENQEATDEQLLAMVSELEDAMNVSIMSGDVNMDGNITITDATLIQLYLLGQIDAPDINVGAADTDGDTEITINDVTEIQKYIVGAVDTLATYVIEVK